MIKAADVLKTNKWPAGGVADLLRARMRRRRRCSIERRHPLFQVGLVVPGVVTKVASYGVFLNLLNGIVGLVPNKVRQARDEMSRGVRSKCMSSRCAATWPSELELKFFLSNNVPRMSTATEMCTARS